MVMQSTPAANQLVVDVRGQPRAARHVFRVGDHQVQLFSNPQSRHGAEHDLPSGLAHDVADQEEPHGRTF